MDVTTQPALSHRLVMLPFAALLLAALSWSGPVLGAEALYGSGELGSILSIEELKLDGDQVTGLLVNRSDKTLRDVRLQIIFSWLWKNERHPGPNDPSFVVTEIPNGEVPPHGTLPFHYAYPSVVTSRTDGQFMMDARVLGYSAVGQTTTVPAP